MRNLLKISLLAIAVVMAASCAHEATYLKSDSHEINIAKGGGNDSVVLHSDGSEFEVISSSDWVNVTLKDSILYVKVDENKTNGMRSGSVVVKNGSQKLSLPISQATHASYMTIKRKSVTIGQKGEPDTLSVMTDGSDIRIENIEGIQTEFKNGVLTLKGDGNNGATRKTKAKLVCDSISVDLLVIERGTTCNRCKGSGKITCYICHGEGMTYCPWDVCRTCGGRRIVNCPECKGNGK